MDEQKIYQNQKEKTTVLLSIDPGKDLFEEFDFRPINKGLGFHQQQRDIYSTNRTKISAQKSIQQVKKTPSIPISKNTNEVPKTDLQQIYKTEEIINKVKTETNNSENKSTAKFEGIVEAAVPARFLAYVIDIFFISCLYSLMGSAILLISKLDFNALVDSLGVDVFWLTFGFTFSMAYLFYFSILDINATVGKAVFGIRVTSENGERLDLKTTFVRSLITLFSFILLGLPSIMNFQSQLTATKVVKNGDNV